MHSGIVFNFLENIHQDTDINKFNSSEFKNGKKLWNCIILQTKSQSSNYISICKKIFILKPMSKKDNTKIRCSTLSMKNEVASIYIV